jgi:tripartite-type tricarboxylate transporter receptor subunit TctC
VFDTYCALLAPAKTPHEIVRKMEKVGLDVLAKAEFRQKLIIAGFDVTAMDAKGHDARIAKEIPMFRKIIEDAKIQKL